MHPTFGDDVIDTNIHQGLFVLLYVAVESEVSKLFHKIHQFFAKSLLRIVEVVDGGPFFILEVLLAELGYHLVPVSDRAWCKSSIPCVSSVSQGLGEFPQSKIVVPDMWTK